MKTIVKPSLFYWIEVVDYLREWFQVIGLSLAVVGAIVGLLIYINEDINEEEDKTIQPTLKPINKGIIIGVIGICLTILAGFIPTKQTLIEIEVSRHITYNTIEKTEEKAKDLVDYIVTKANEITTNKPKNNTKEK